MAAGGRAGGADEQAPGLRHQPQDEAPGSGSDKVKDKASATAAARHSRILSLPSPL